MYKQRLYIVISLCIAVIAVCLLRLIHLQVIQGRDYRDRVAQMRILAPVQLPTVRGKILDRNGCVLAFDKAAFHLYANYELTRLLDDRFWEANILKEMSVQEDRGQAERKVREKYRDNWEHLTSVINKCAEIADVDRYEIENKIRAENDRIWNLGKYISWRRQHPNADMDEYRKAQEFISPAEVIKADIAEMRQSHPLIKLKTSQQLLLAQLEFADTKYIEILPKAERWYPYDSTACQIIGWVGPAQEQERKLFTEDDYLRYLEGEVTGKAGIEKACEVILRGRRGEVTYNKDFMLINRKPTQFGMDVSLSLDIELQKSIEDFLGNPKSNPRFYSKNAAIVLEVATGDILAMVSTPIYDLNSARQDYNQLLASPGAPMKNKCLEEHYPPGSSVKPLILIMGLEEGKITPNKIINCPYERAPRHWPGCWLFTKGGCHDWSWQDQGGNKARNAVRGSCNIYFSRLADKLEPSVFQRWLYDFGYGRRILPGPAIEDGLPEQMQVDRIQLSLRESRGQISSEILFNKVNTFEDIPRLLKAERRLFGIGQGNLRTTILQVANAAAAIARGGIYKRPRLFLSESDIYNSYQVDLSISKRTIAIVRDGMKAVVNESDGTAYKAFRNSGLSEQDITVYGKTGSTQAPSNAWFMCFAEDSSGRAVVITLMVEGGESGGQDAAPLGRDIIRFCNEAGYVGKMPILKDQMLSPGEGK